MILLEHSLRKLTWTFSMLVLSSTLASAADEEFCSDYVLIAISQYWQSIDQGCGYTGVRWSANYKGQFDWCLSAHQWVAENEMDTRAQLLEECRSAPSANHDAEITDDNHSVNKTSSENKGDLNERLLHAVAKNDLEETKRLVAEGADIRFVTNDSALIKTLGMSSYSIKADNASKSSVLTSSKATVAKLNNDNASSNDQDVGLVESESLLSYASSKGLVDVGLWLLKQDEPLLTPKKKEGIRADLLGRALIQAVKSKDSEKVSEYLDKGASVNYELDQNFGTPLYFAVIQGDISLAKTLLEKGANLKYSTNAGKNMLSFALDKPKLLALLLDHGADPNSNGESPNIKDYPLIEAVKQGDASVVELLMSHGADANIYDYEVQYPLLQAIANQQVEIVEVLLEHKVDPNVVYNESSPGICAKNSGNIAPLSEAMKIGNSDIIMALREAGAKTVEEICKQ